MTKTEIRNILQDHADRLTDALSKAINRGNEVHEDRIRAALFEVETLAVAFGVTIDNNFDPLA